MIKKQILLVFSASSLVLSGCVKELGDPRVVAKPVEQIEDVVKEIEAEVVEAVEDAEDDKVVVFNDVDSGEVRFTKVTAPKNPVDINVTSEIPFSYIIESIASDRGWSVQYGPGVNKEEMVSVQISNMEMSDAMEDVAGLAGYTIVLDEEKRRCTVTQRATWTFLLPPNVSDVMSWEYSVGGTPETSAGDEEGGGGLESSSTITGSNAVNTPDVIQFILNSINGADVAGVEPASITNMSSMGVVLVEGNVRQLNRAERLITRLVEEASTRVEINVAVVDISLDNSESLGFDWRVALESAADAGTILPVGGNAANFTGNGGALSIGITKGSIASLLTAARSMTDISVISRPNMVVDNHTPADISDSVSRSYLSSITVTEDGTESSTDYEISSATEGLKVSVLPHVLPGGKVVQLKVIPYFGEVSFANRTIGTDTIQIPTVESKQGFFSATIETGDTIILGGIIQDKQESVESGLPFVSTPLTDRGADVVEVSELAYIINTRVIPAPKIEVVLDKSL